METTDYRLRFKGKCTYVNKEGSRVPATYITLQEPEYTNPENFYKLQDIITAAQANMTKIIDMSILDNEEVRVAGEVGGESKPFHEMDREDSLDEKIEGMKQSLRAAEKTPQFIKIFKKMISVSKRRNPCLVDGEVGMTEAILQKMHPFDVEGMALKWCGFFILALEEQEKKSSGKATDSATTVKEL